MDQEWVLEWEECMDQEWEDMEWDQECMVQECMDLEWEDMEWDQECMDLEWEECIIRSFKLKKLLRL
jgi:hypothetical protein